MSTRRLATTTLVAATMLLAACGGSSDDATQDDEPDAADSTESTTAATDDGATSDTAAAETTAPEDASGADDFEPGEVQFRVVNILDDPVDVYVRTTGLVQAYSIDEGVEPGEVTELVAPPDNGVFLVTEAGAGDPTCVSGCDHFIAELSALDDRGPIQTVVLYSDESGEPSAYDLWEQPEPTTAVNTNAMAPADPANGVVVVLGVALTDVDFGLRLAVDGTPGCLEPFNLENILVGGNQTPAFAYDGAAVDLVLHDNADRECAEEPVGGPFTVDGGPGERSLLLLTGSSEEMDALVVPMIAADGATGGDQGDAASDDRGLAIELMTGEVEANLGLAGDQAACAAELLVDAIGADQLLQDGELIDLDSVGTQFDVPAQQALVDAITACGIDPEQLGN